MAKKKKLSAAMSRQETLWGWIYLMAQLFVLPVLLPYCNALLPKPLNAVWVNLVFYSIGFFACALIFRGFLKRNFRATGKNFGAFLLYTVLAFGLYWLSGQILSRVLHFLRPGFSNVNDSTIIAMANTNFWGVAICTVVLVPFIEELLYRGLLFQGLYRRSRFAAYAVSTAVFCAIHITGYIGSESPVTLLLCFMQYIPAGLCLAWAYAQTGTIFAPILIHTVINALGVYTMR